MTSLAAPVIPFEERRKLPFLYRLPQLSFRGYCFATAKVIYHLPDHPVLLQEFLWQRIDVSPNLPRLLRFLNHWHRNIVGHISSIEVACAPIVSEREIRHAKVEFKIH